MWNTSLFLQDPLKSKRVHVLVQEANSFSVFSQMLSMFEEQEGSVTRGHSLHLAWSFLNFFYCDSDI